MAKKYYKIPNRTPKRAAQERQFHQKDKPEYLEENPYCEAKLNVCTYQAIEVHHKKGRIGDLLNDKKYFLSVCRNCHEWIESHPKEAKELNLSISRLAKNV